MKLLLCERIYLYKRLRWQTFKSDEFSKQNKKKITLKCMEKLQL